MIQAFHWAMQIGCAVRLDKMRDNLNLLAYMVAAGTQQASSTANRNSMKEAKSNETTQDLQWYAAKLSTSKLIILMRQSCTLRSSGLTKQKPQIIFSESSQSFCVLANSALKH